MGGWAGGSSSKLANIKSPSPAKEIGSAQMSEIPSDTAGGVDQSEAAIHWGSSILPIDSDAMFRALEQGFRIEMIATFRPDLVCCAADWPLTDVLQEKSLSKFDHLPVIRTEGAHIIVGLLNRLEAVERWSEAAGPDTVATAMHRLDEEILVSADTAILTFLEHADQRPCRLVLHKDHIDGIVTIADLQKLPVRALLFLLVAHVELLLAENIRRAVSSDADWLSALCPKRRESVEAGWQELKKANMAIDRLSASQFCDKREALVQLVQLPDLRTSQARNQLMEIEKMRNEVVHAVEYAHDRASAHKTIRRSCLARTWIDRLSKMLHRA